MEDEVGPGDSNDLFNVFMLYGAEKRACDLSNKVEIKLYNNMRPNCKKIGTELMMENSTKNLRPPLVIGTSWRIASPSKTQ